MSHHPAIQSGNVAVITGAADGIGLAAARRFAELGMRVCMADRNVEKLEAAAKEIDGAMAIPTDVSQLAEVEALRNAALDAHGQVDVLMNNAGFGLPAQAWSDYDSWRALIETNLWGVIHGIQAFTEKMIAQGTPGLIVNTGSKQGITSPPGSVAYNVSKAAVKVTTENLAHGLRGVEGCQVTAHLLVPGLTFTGVIRQFIQEKPPGAWDPEQVIDFMLESLARGDFYILCPDNEVDRELDNRRMEWAMGDLVHNRPALSRWHPDYAEAFQAFVEKR